MTLENETNNNPDIVVSGAFNFKSVGQKVNGALPALVRPPQS